MFLKMLYCSVTSHLKNFEFFYGKTENKNKTITNKTTFTWHLCNNVSKII